MNWQREVFEKYAAERRLNDIPGYRVETLADITRHIPKRDDGEALLSFASFRTAAADDRIRAELQRARDTGLETEWKIHDFDEPSDLKMRLEREGLHAHHTEALMVLDAAAASVMVPKDDVFVVEAASGSQLDELASLQEEVWRMRLPWLADVLHAMADPVSGTGTAYRARIHDRVVGSGWIDFPRGSRFAQLCGGAVIEEFRGRGIYSRLFARRVGEAKARGVPWIAVDAAPMSRPILERKGFRFVCHTYPMRTRRFDTRPVTHG